MNYYDSMFHAYNVDEEQLKSDLTVYGKGFKNANKIVRCYKKKKGEFLVPIHYANMQEWLDGAEDRIPDRSIDWPEAEFIPRHDQQQVIDKVIPYLKENFTGRISCPTSWGKTMCALQIAKLLKQNVLFLAHKDDILKQVETTAKVYFKVDCGWIKGKKLQLDNIITLSTMQTMAKRVLEQPEILDTWGLILLDESHRSSCESYVKIMENLVRRYTLGVSATFRRGDNLEGVWENYLGPEIAKGKKSKVIIPQIETPRVPCNISMRDFFDWRGEISHTKALTVIAKNFAFNKWLVVRIIELRVEGRRPLIVTNRKEQLEILEDWLRQEGYQSIGIYAGGKHRDKILKPEHLTEAMKQDIVLATVKKVGEGFDEAMFLGKEELAKLQPLDTIVIASPISDSEQIIGRIGREETKNLPLIIHPVVKVPYCEALFNKCVKNTYRPLGIIR